VTQLIVFDYDGTLTEFPDQLLPLVEAFKKAGHRVILATMRHDNSAERLPFEIEALFEHGIVYTGRKAKYPVVLEKYGKADLWIEDQPHFLFNDAR
tara:strand:+ start:284 stop:571 length:288 start_codon:yes stop_codon:yes gene_type:complete